jgi:iduronate 2-sulfatase
MRALFLSLLAVLPTFATKPNILLLCVDDLRPELKSLGAEHIHSPAMDSLVTSGRAFTNHYVQAPTCGASRYSLLTGRYASTPRQQSNDAFFCPEARKPGLPPSLPAHFRSNGYQTISIGKISHHPGGLGGENWNNPAQVEMPGAWDISLMPTEPWKTPKGGMHGYAGGVPRGPYRPAREHIDGNDFTYTDGWITREALQWMDDLAKADKPFLLAVGIMKPHLPFACPKSYLDLYQNAKLPAIPHPRKPEGLSTWHPSNEFFSYHHEVKKPRDNAAYADQMRLSYAACVSYADAQVAQILARLEKLELDTHTIVVLWGDHGYHLGEHAIWGKHALFEESLHAPLVIRKPGLPQPGARTQAVVESIDLYPTLCELAALPTPPGLSGQSLATHLADPSLTHGEAFAYAQGKYTIRTNQYRLIRHPRKNQPDDFELYDHHSTARETNNLAASLPDVVKSLNAVLEAKIQEAKARGNSP